MSMARKPNTKARKDHRTGATRAWRLPIVSAIALVLGLTTVLATTGFDESGLASAAVAQAKSFLQLIQGRSPGVRTSAILVKTKHKRLLVHERALPKIRMAVATVPPPIPWIDQPALI